jgi:phytoene dehydrogenase-like protein
VKEAFLSVPSPFELGKRFLLGRAFGGDWQRALRTILRPYGEVVDDYFREEKVKAPLVWMAAQSGPPPTEPLSAPFLLWQPLYHEGGIARPRGGSGMLTQALARTSRHHGGAVHTGAGSMRSWWRRKRAVGVRVGGRSVHRARRGGRRRTRSRPSPAPPRRAPAAAAREMRSATASARSCASR